MQKGAYVLRQSHGTEGRSGIINYVVRAADSFFRNQEAAQRSAHDGAPKESNGSLEQSQADVHRNLTGEPLRRSRKNKRAKIRCI